MARLPSATTADSPPRVPTGASFPSISGSPRVMLVLMTRPSSPASSANAPGGTLFEGHSTSFSCSGASLAPISMATAATATCPLSLVRACIHRDAMTTAATPASKATSNMSKPLVSFIASSPESSGSRRRAGCGCAVRREVVVPGPVEHFVGELRLAAGEGGVVRDLADQVARIAGEERALVAHVVVADQPLERSVAVRDIALRADLAHDAAVVVEPDLADEDLVADAAQEGLIGDVRGMEAVSYTHLTLPTSDLV